MSTDRRGVPDDGRDVVHHYVPGATLSDPNRRHVTLDNLVELADLGSYPALTGGAPGNGAEPEPFDEDPAYARVPWAQPAERWLLELLALAGASLAFVSPSVWLLVVVVGCVAGGIAAFIASGHPPGALPRRVVRRSVTLLHPRSSLWAPALLARVVLLAVLLPGGSAALGWFLGEGSPGALVAARTAAWAHGPRVAAMLICLMLLVSVGDGRQHRARAVRRWARPATDGTLVLLAVSCVAVAGLAIGAAPHPADPLASRADGLGLLPPGTRAAADRVRDDIVTNELDTVAACLSSQERTIWRTHYSSENPAGAPDVARLVAAASHGDATRDLATAILALHNQLAPWVETIEVELREGDVVRTDRTLLPRSTPLTDAALLVAATTTGQERLMDASSDLDATLRCSAGPVL